jgi:hypothetical protein
MCETNPRRKLARRHPAALAGAALLLLAGSATIRAAGAAEDGVDSPGLWDSLLRKLNVKAAPAEPAPEFVRRTRPDPSRLDYMQPAVPHKVSPLKVKSLAEIQAAKNALDAAKIRQLNPTPKPPLELSTSSRPAAKTKPAAPVD